MPAILPLAPSAALTPDGLLAPSSSTTYLDAPAGALPLTGSATDLYGIPIEYIDAPVGHIGGTLVVGGGGIVKVGGSSVNQQPERKPRTYPQQQPPRLIHIEYQAGHDAPTGHINLAGTLSEEYEAILSHDIRDLERLIRSLYPGGGSIVVTAATKPASTRELLEPFTGGSTDEQ